MVAVEQFSGNDTPWEAFNERELARAEGMPVNKRRHEWLAGRYAAKVALRSWQTFDRVDELSAITIENSNRACNKGQPVASIKEAYVSISHSWDVAVAVVSAAPVGVDVEKLRAFSPAAEDMAFTASEKGRDSIISPGGERRWLTLAWCFKEAFMKAHGRGVFGWFHDLELQRIDQEGRLTWKSSPRLHRQLGRAMGLAGYGVAVDGYGVVVVGTPISPLTVGLAGGAR